MKKTGAILVIAAWGLAATALPTAGATGAGAPGPPVGQRQDEAVLGAETQVEAERTLHLSLGEAIQLAEGLAPRLGEFRAMISLAEAGLVGAKAGRLPQIDLLAGYRRYNNVPEWTVQQGPDEVLIFPNLPNFWQLEVNGLMPLYDGGRVKSNIEAAEHTIAASNRDLESQTADLELQVTSVYWQLALAREQEGILAQSIDSFEAHLFDARNREEVGLAASNEALAVQTERDRAELRRLLAASSVNTTQDRLAVLLGLPVGSRIVPTDDLDLDAMPKLGVDALVASALEQRTERQALQQRFAAAEAKLDAANALRKPQIGITGGVRYLNPDRRVVPPTDDFRFAWDIGVGLRYSIYDGGSRNAAATAALAELDVVRRRLEELDRAIRTQVVQSYQSLETARAAIGVAEQARTSAGANLRVTRDLYQEGMIPSSERLDAEMAELIAGLELTEATIAVQIARASLHRAVGQGSDATQ